MTDLLIPQILPGSIAIPRLEPLFSASYGSIYPSYLSCFIFSNVQFLSAKNSCKIGFLLNTKQEELEGLQKNLLKTS
jgi:hypothetical protein